MVKRLSLLIIGTTFICGMLLAAVFMPLESSSINPDDLIVDAPEPPPEGMVWVPGGTFVMGTDEVIDPTSGNPDRIKEDEIPAHTVELDGFYMDEAPVTNGEFA